MKRFLTLLFLFCVSLAHAQFTITQPNTKPTNPTADFGMPAGKIYINQSTVPKARFGYSTDRVQTACTRVGGAPNTGTCTPSALDGDDLNPQTGVPPSDGAFRTDCQFSHASYDDPIVWPGQPGKTHGHAFYGNTLTSPFTVNMGSAGNSTCTGGTVNRTGYWIPFMVYHRPGNIRDGEALVAYTMVAYYKTFTSASITNMTWPAVNFRMIAGNPNSTVAQSTGVVRFDCLNTSTGATQSFNHIPTTAEATALGAGNCGEIIELVFFPQCWDGSSVGGLAGKGHVDYQTSYAASCSDPAFSHQLPWISINAHFKPKALADLDYLRLSSDAPATSGYPAGHSGHADWWNGWKAAPLPNGEVVTDMIIRNCEKGRADCHANILGSTVAAPNTVYRLY